ncbi:MAG TPA: 1-(5-phosphoribosyl)-5-[(5-phosphoribosylamino)methylideneamino]imidazole-4-carboxamide isomerase [Solirubrobacterales bacterium]
MILYPAIDIRDGHAVRLLRGDYEQETVYDADPAEAARRWAAEGARYLHVVDLDGAREGRPMNLGAVERIASAVDVLVQVGGGLRNTEAIAAALDAGASRVVLGTAAMRDRELVRAALDAHGERLVISVDARGGRVAVQGWTESGDVDVAAAVGELSGEGVRHFVFTPIDVDGTMEGPGTEELRRVAGATEAELIYSGGVGELAHLRTLASEAPSNVTGVIVGRALYEGRFSVAEAQEALVGP